MKKQFLITIIAINFFSCKSQDTTNALFTKIINEVNEISQDTSFNKLDSQKRINYKLYSKLITSYKSIDSVYAINSKGIKYKGTWSGYINNDISNINVDNTDEYGNVIDGIPAQIEYKNKISILGKLTIDSNYVILPIKVETYNFFVIHLFSFNKNGKLTSVIPVGKIEKANNKKDWLAVQNAYIDKNKYIHATYVAEALVEMKYIFKNGHFQVIERNVDY